MHICASPPSPGIRLTGSPFERQRSNFPLAYESEGKSIKIKYLKQTSKRIAGANKQQSNNTDESPSSKSEAGDF